MSSIFDFGAFLGYLFNPSPLVINGIKLTIILTIVCEIFGIIIGAVAALARLSKSRMLRFLSFGYSWVIRGIPQLLLISIVYFAGFPFFGLSIFGGYSWGDIEVMGFVISGPILAGIFALSINEGAYMSEFIRAGIASIEKGQMDAARSIGMTRAKAMKRIILPQAARVVVPALGNQVNITLKVTSLLSIISVTELYTASTIVQGQTFQPFEVYGAAAVYYLILSSLWAYAQHHLEVRAGRGWGIKPENASNRFRLGRREK